MTKYVYSDQVNRVKQVVFLGTVPNNSVLACLIFLDTASDFLDAQYLIFLDTVPGISEVGT